MFISSVPVIVRPIQRVSALPKSLHILLQFRPLLGSAFCQQPSSHPQKRASCLHSLKSISKLKSNKCPFWQKKLCNISTLPHPKNDNNHKFIIVEQLSWSPNIHQCRHALGVITVSSAHLPIILHFQPGFWSANQLLNLKHWHEVMADISSIL